MKTTIPYIAMPLLLLLAVVGCNTSSSEQFNPHIDGYWGFIGTSDIPDSQGVTKGYFNIYDMVVINYPQIHGCNQYVEVVDGDTLSNIVTKEDLELIHNKENIYEIIKENGAPAGDDAPLLKMRADTGTYQGLTIEGAGPNANNDHGHYYGKEGSPARYHTCRRIANYSKELF